MRSSVVRDVILREGETLRLRAPGAADAPGITQFLENLSEHSRYLRFHGIRLPSAGLVAPFLDPDWRERGSLVGTMQLEGEDRIVALASWARLRDPRLAEIAFAVADAFQGQGIATRLLEQLAELAGEAGVERFVAEVLSENVAMLSVFTERDTTSRASSTAARSKLPFRSLRPSATARQWTGATTPRSSPPCGRSSSPRRSQSGGVA